MSGCMVASAAQTMMRTLSRSRLPSPRTMCVKSRYSSSNPKNLGRTPAGSGVSTFRLLGIRINQLSASGFSASTVTGATESPAAIKLLTTFCNCNQAKRLELILGAVLVRSARPYDRRRSSKPAIGSTRPGWTDTRLHLLLTTPAAKGRNSPSADSEIL